jgi:hypothetical protein
VNAPTTNFYHNVYLKIYKQHVLDCGFFPDGLVKTQKGNVFNVVAFFQWGLAFGNMGWWREWRELYHC